jgi:hypothetical protein
MVGVAAALVHTRSIDPFAITKRDAIRPNKNLGPEDVVRYQLNALQLADVTPESFGACYAFASPGNKQAFSDIEQFRDMLARSYPTLIGHRQAVVGRAFIEGNFARVLVTGYDANKRVMCYEFFLAKQGHQPYLDCWMTDSVFTVISFDVPQNDSTPTASKRTGGNRLAARM